MKPVHFVGNTRTTLRGFPDRVKERIGYALYEAQLGGKATHVKPMKGFKGSRVLEVIEDFDGDTYRAVYTGKFANAVYVLHTFPKKSKKGIATPKRDIDLITSRLKLAEEDFERENKS
ncbi:MAG: type II toxin-antitoxin system RelE/ParE family toxin [Nitrospirales bacterium]|nr:type II toxin-antitoxin system RelE/ParE family toxin [Nitrospirales bacterium]